MSKKLIISIMLVGTLIISSAIGSFAWFTTNTTSQNNQISVGTLQLNDHVDSVTGTLFNNTNQSVVQPGFSQALTPITIKNTGTLAMYIDSTVSIMGVSQLSDSGNKFMIAPLIKFNDMPLPLTYVKPDGTILYNDCDGNTYMPIDEFKMVIEQLMNNQSQIDHNAYYTIGGTLKLDTSAGNEYQGVTLTINLSFTGEQTTKH